MMGLHQKEEGMESCRSYLEKYFTGESTGSGGFCYKQICQHLKLCVSIQNPKIFEAVGTSSEKSFPRSLPVIHRKGQMASFRKVIPFLVVVYAQFQAHNVLNWTRVHVSKWIDWCCKEHEMDRDEDIDLSMNDRNDLFLILYTFSSQKNYKMDLDF
ncbi:hypothetical protein GQR58_008202 [Nymphon striatum]|nr:hypothetical protein GQR58_008202 [Nymphon striatum]